MLSFASILILQVAVLAVVLESDLDRRKVGWFRVLRPVITIIIIVPFFFTTVPTSGRDLALQGIGVLIGVALGLLSVSPWLVSVGFDAHFHSQWSRRRERDGRPAAVTHADVGYAIVWIAVSVARLAFAYTAQHVFRSALGHFLIAHQLNARGLTNALIFLSIGMDLSRSILLIGRGRTALRRGRPGLTTRV